jgi:hypothetical protein
MPHSRAATPLPSFWMGGYEGADHVNGAGEALDLVRATGHDRRLDADYRDARRLGLRCVRESIGWRLAERAGGGAWDLSRAVRMAEAARRQRVQILWTLMHYGVPDDLTLLHNELVPRFARFAAEVARVLAPLCPGPRIYTPINEISFLSWAASATCDMGPAGLQPCDHDAEGDTRVSGFLIKQRLVRAALAAMAAIRAVDPAARFMHVEPVVHVAPRDGSDPDQRALAQRISSFQWQTLDMLAGRMEPQLGGHAEALDLLGLNHYHTSQWEVPGEKRLAWHLRDPRRQPLSLLLHEVWRRYRRPLVMAETGHIGVGRAAWLHEVAGEALRARALGVPLLGVCLYPLLDRPDWNDPRRWHRSGLWHVPQPEPGLKPARRLNRPFARALLAWRGLNDGKPPAAAAEDAPGLLVLLPCAWEDWAAPRAHLLRAWSASCVLRVLEPPRHGPDEPLLRCHTLAPGAELLVLHGGGGRGDGHGGWALGPGPAQLALLRQAQAQAGPRRWVVWLAGWRADGDARWWQALDGGGLVLQPDAEQPPAADVVRHARVRLPVGWPGPVCTPRAAPPRGYEDEEIGQLLQGIAAPRVWLTLPPPAQGGHVSPKLARRLRAAAWRQPALQLVIDGREPACDEPRPPNLHWLGPVHESLHAGLAARMQGIVRWDGLAGSNGVGGDADGAILRPEQLADMVARALQPFLEPVASAPMPLMPPLPEWPVRPRPGSSA